MKKFVIGLVMVASLSLFLVPLSSAKLYTPAKAGWGCVTPNTATAIWG